MTGKNPGKRHEEPTTAIRLAKQTNSDTVFKPRVKNELLLGKRAKGPILKTTRKPTLCLCKRSGLTVGKRGKRGAQQGRLRRDVQGGKEGGAS